MKPKTFTLKLTQFDHFRSGGGARLRKRPPSDVSWALVSRANAFSSVKGDDVNVRVDGDLYPATVADIYVEGGWMYAHLVPRKASHV